jgi:DNA-binding transcriptional LysR family regulator
MDRLGNLEAFVEAAQRGSFTLAAERLQITPSAVSRRVAQLEDELGVSLFHRTTRALRLSDDGRAFFERACNALRELDEARDSMRRLRDRPAGLLRAVVPTIEGRHDLVPRLPQLLARNPDLQVDLTFRDEPTDFVAMGVDVGLRLGPLEDSSLVARRLGWTRMRVCGAPSYLHRKGRPRTVDALSRHERLAIRARGRVMPWRLRDGDRLREIPPGERIVVDHADALVDLAIGGAGLAWVCDFMIARAKRAGQLVEVLEGSSSERTPIHALSLPSRHVLPKVRAFVDFAAAALAKAGIDRAKTSSD